MDWDSVGNDSCEHYNQQLVRRQERREITNQVINDEEEVNNIGEGRLDVISTYQNCRHTHTIII